MPKVKFGFKNAYYSKLINTEGVISYAKDQGCRSRLR